MWMAVCGDLRFASHHDMMRVIERTLLRANLPLRYSQGFSPRAVLSLSFPRPVGVATRRDLLVAALDSPVVRHELLAAANRHCPEGLNFVDATLLESKATPIAVECTYQIPVPAEKTDAVTRAVEHFSARDTFTVQRTKPPKRRGRRVQGEAVTRTLDLKLLVDNVEFDGETLSWRQAPHESRWAKPTEAMQALGLDSAGDMALVTRTSLVFQGLNEYSGEPDEKIDGEPETI
jgi:radical SAM-linked protein